MTLFEHLAELRSRLIICVVAVIVGTVVAWFFYDDVVHFMTRPYREFLRHHPSQDISKGNLVTTGPLEGFTTRLKVTVYLGIALAVAGAVLGVVAVHHPRPAQEREALRHALRGRRGRPVLGRGHHGHPGLSEGARLADLGVSGTRTSPPCSRRPATSTCTSPMCVIFGVVFMFPLVVVFLRDRRGRSERQVAEVAPAGDRGDLPGRRGDHAEQRSVLVPGHGRADVDVLRGVDHHRPSLAEVGGAGGDPGLASRPRSASRSTGSSARPSTPSTPGGSVVVAAPTGSGKTVVAEYAVARALARGRQGLLHHARSRRCPTRSTATWSAATAPSAVGLLTGDNAINGDAPVVVMTTEVLRNMIYAGSPSARRAALRGPRRGPLPAERLPGPGVGGGHHPRPATAWTWSACRPRCPTPRSWPTGSAPSGARPTAVIEDRRPVELHNLYLLGDRASERLLLLPTLVDGRPNPEAVRPRLARRCAIRACGAGRGAGCSRPGGSRCVELLAASTTCCRRSTSSSAGPRATTPWPSASGRDSG